MSHVGLRGLAVATALAVALQSLLPSIVLAHDFSIPGGTSPTPPSNPSGGDSPPRNPSTDHPPVQGDTDPIDIHRGDFVLTRQDLFLPGRGLSVDLSFTYRSRSGHNSRFGYGWELSYHRRAYSGDIYENRRPVKYFLRVCATHLFVRGSRT